MRSNPITWKRFLDRSRADFASLREFVVSSYKDPVWIIASVAFVTVIPWEFSFWNGVPEKIANLQRTTQTQSDFVRHQALAIELQEGVLHSLEMESMASQYIHDKGILTHVSTPADAAQCLELVEKAHLEYVISSAAVSAVEFHERVLTDFQSALRDDLKCMETELQKIKTLCKNKDQAKLNPVQAELFSNSLRCLKASEVQKESLEADFKATFKKVAPNWTSKEYASQSSK